MQAFLSSLKRHGDSCQGIELGLDLVKIERRLFEVGFARTMTSPEEPFYRSVTISPDLLDQVIANQSGQLQPKRKVVITKNGLPSKTYTPIKVSGASLLQDCYLVQTHDPIDSDIITKTGIGFPNAVWVSEKLR